MTTPQINPLASPLNRKPPLRLLTQQEQNTKAVRDIQRAYQRYRRHRYAITGNALTHCKAMPIVVLQQLTLEFTQLKPSAS